uniref:FYVE-type domain-containing protein n=1 Tax=Clastoptera arizonana TaxID=38151 RepID=A0A1B6E4F3_9HEMI
MDFNKTKRNSFWSPTSFGTPPAIMESIDSSSMISQNHHLGDLENNDSNKHNSSLGLPDITLTSEFTSLKLGPLSEGNLISCFLLLDGKEHLKVTSSETFVLRLNSQDPLTRVKVVSIFGNTGDGKSHTLNHTFYSGEEVFRTSCEQDSCTLGVWASYDPQLKVILLDTEGLLGSTSNENQRTRLLLKVLAISDIVIYRTRSERLHRDLFTFLGSASRAYTQHFQTALVAVGQRGDFGGPLSALGPAVIIFHETRHTRTLHSANESAEDILRQRFAQLHLEMEAFSSVKYIGVQTLNPPTNFSPLRSAIRAELENTTVRSPRSPHLVFNTLKALNDKFSGVMATSSQLLFPDQYFTCTVQCLSCEKRCDKSMGHLHDSIPHSSSHKCRYQHQYDNCSYICKTCHTNGNEVIVHPKYTSSTDNSWFGIAKFAWSGYVIECPNCGEIYRSRQFWYGNTNPEISAVRTEIKHVWPGSSIGNQAGQNSAQRMIDGVSYLTEAVSNVSSQPTKLLSSWMADQIAPKYWKPNHEIKNCIVCHKWFSPTQTKHHCRACGEGVCEDCSTRNKIVPERGWHYPVRVCDKCFKQRKGDPNSDSNSSLDENEVRVRMYGEAVVNTLSSVASVLEYPKSLIKDTARPIYWVPDCDIKECCVCGGTFNPPRFPFHHCRDCGGGVCPNCSSKRKPVPHRGWTSPVRVCDRCCKDE